MKKLTITIEKRHDDYMAYLNGNRTLWDCGRSRAEAIGNVIRTHGRDYRITIEADSA